MASRRTKSAEVCFLADLGILQYSFNGGGIHDNIETVAADVLLPPEQSCALLFSVICNAPKPVLRLLEKIAASPSLPAFSSAVRHRRDGTRETLNERLCRIVKVDPKTIDLVGMVKMTLAG